MNLNGEVVLSKEEAKLGVKNKTVTITGGTLNLSEISELQLLGNVIFEDMTLVVDSNSIYANGNELVVSEDVTFDGTVDAIYGGGKSNATWSTNLTLLSGNYKEIYGGSNSGIIFGDTLVVVGGEVNADIDVADHNLKNRVYGGGYNDLINGNTYVTIKDSAQTSVVYGGGNGTDSNVQGTCHVNVTGGNVMGYYGGSYQGTVCNTVVNMTAGKAEQIFGGCELASMTGNVDVTITGGTISRRIYGGCYNEYTDGGWKSSHHINGNVYLTIGPNANINYSSTESDRGVFGGSRYKSGFSDEKVTLILLDGCKDVSGRDSSDWKGIVLGSPKKYDKLEQK